MGFVLSQVNDRNGLIVMDVIFSLLISAVTALRFYSRRLKKLEPATDDWLALGGLLCVLALNGIFLGGLVEGAVTGHSPVVNNWPLTTELEHTAQKYKYLFNVIEKPAFGLIKLSLLFQWKRIFSTSKTLCFWSWVMIGVITAWTVAFTFATIFQCGLNWRWNWEVPVAFFLSQCSNTLVLLTVFAATDLCTDFIIMFMPVPFVWGLQMPLKKKLGVTSIFMVGLFTIGAGIARLYAYLVPSFNIPENPDFIASFTVFILWSIIEANVAMIVCCMPPMGVVLRAFFSGLETTMKSSRSSKSQKSQKSQWLPLSGDREHTGTSHAGVKLSPARMTKHIPTRRFEEDELGMVATADFAGLDNPAIDGRGILARTEIYTTSEPIGGRGYQKRSYAHETV